MMTLKYNLKEYKSFPFQSTKRAPSDCFLILKYNIPQKLHFINFKKKKILVLHYINKNNVSKYKLTSKYIISDDPITQITYFINTELTSDDYSK